MLGTSLFKIPLGAILDTLTGQKWPTDLTFNTSDLGPYDASKLWCSQGHIFKR